ncbi:MAG: lycopene cyclase domain-containing protein [Saprospiraceae bacterium]|nr:lycopene cyclase domain-containing protein [Saprospiraceae bacterium]
MKTKNYLSLFLFTILGILLLWIINHSIETADFQKDVFSIREISVFETNYLYFIHHVLCFFPVLLLSVSNLFFPSRFHFIREWIKPIVLGSIIFCSWDIVFTELGIWAFNKKYVVANRLLGFPIEEILWFPVIGYCSLFVHALLTKKDSGKVKLIVGRILIVLFSLLMFILIALYTDRLYTAFTAWFVLAVIALFLVTKKEQELNKISTSFIVILAPMILADGLLTGLFSMEPVVLYNPMEFSEIRLLSIPIEDFAFGYAFLSVIVWLKTLINN